MYQIVTGVTSFLPFHFHYHSFFLVLSLKSNCVSTLSFGDVFVVYFQFAPCFNTPFCDFTFHFFGYSTPSFQDFYLETSVCILWFFFGFCTLFMFLSCFFSGTFRCIKAAILFVWNVINKPQHMTCELTRKFQYQRNVPRKKPELKSTELCTIPYF